MNYKLLTLASTMSLMAMVTLSGQSLVSAEGKVRVSSPASGEQVEARVGTVFAVGELVTSDKDKTVLAFPNARLFLNKSAVVAMRADGVELLAGRVSVVVNDKATFPLVIGNKQYAISGTAVATLDKIGESNVTVVAGEALESDLANAGSPTKKFQSGQMSNLAANKSLKKLMQDGEDRRKYSRTSGAVLFTDDDYFETYVGALFESGTYLGENKSHLLGLETGFIFSNYDAVYDVGQSRVVPLLVTYKYRLKLSEQFAVYVGGNAGAYYVSAYVDGLFDESAIGAAGSGMIGLEFLINDSFAATAGYRLVYTSDAGVVEGITASAIEAGVVFKY